MRGVISAHDKCQTPMELKLEPMEVVPGNTTKAPVHWTGAFDC